MVTAESPIPGSINLRPATLADAPLLRRWDEQPHVVASDPNDDWDWENELARTPEWREQLIAELNAEPIGFLQIIDPAREDSHYWGEVGPGFRAIDIWIGDASNLGRGYGTAIMRRAIDRCFAENNVHTILLDPLIENVRAHRFYQRLGFRPVGLRRFGQDNCLVHQLEREDWKRGEE